MIAAVESLLRHLGWSEHQAIIFAHKDTAHPHVHVVLNGVHPETGRKFDERNDWTRAESWGLAYEREHGGVRCKQRLLPRAERSPTPTRATWEQLREYQQAELGHEQRRQSGNWDYVERKDPDDRRNREWEMLREHQREEREAFFADGKQVYRQVSQDAYRRVRDEFRHEWKDFYSAGRDGLQKADLARLKADVLSRQKQALEVEWGKASKSKRGERDEAYRNILARQRNDRRELREAQEQGRTHAVLDIVTAAQSRRDRTPPAHTVERRPASPTRDRWEPLRDTEKAVERDRGYLARQPSHRRARQERLILRASQKSERETHYSEGRQELRNARKLAREAVRAEMRATVRAIRQANAAGLNRTELAAQRAVRLRQSRETAKLRANVAARGVMNQLQRDGKAMGLHHKAERNVLRKRGLDGHRSYRVMDQDRALISASEAVRQDRERDAARQKEWRQSRPEPYSTMASVEADAARFKEALRGATERVTKTAEFEDRVKLSWRRTRPGPGRGRD
jgi:hypothetical protein